MAMEEVPYAMYATLCSYGFYAARALWTTKTIRSWGSTDYLYNGVLKALGDEGLLDSVTDLAKFL